MCLERGDKVVSSFILIYDRLPVGPLLSKGA